MSITQTLIFLSLFFNKSKYFFVSYFLTPRVISKFSHSKEPIEKTSGLTILIHKNFSGIFQASKFHNISVAKSQFFGTKTS